ncbi:MAG: hypothetical protein GX860_08725 [Alcaligenaceae bacterium]|jgi:predicted small secreted protein|nr:hypothetical protein [Alcaligenaceae bacterium]
MKLSRKLGLAILPLAVALAGCQTTGSTSGAGADTQAVVEAQAALQVYQASVTPVQGFRPVQISEQQTIHVSATPVFTAADVTSHDIVADQNNNVYVAVNVTEQGKAALDAVPEGRGYAIAALNRGTNQTEAVSFSGIRQGDNLFLFRVNSEEVASAVVNSVWPQAPQAAQ